MSGRSGRDIIVIGASAGGVQTLTELCSRLPADLPAAVFIVVHTSPTSPGILPQILDRAGPLPAVSARDSMRIEHGKIVVAPPDKHMLLQRTHVSLTRGPKENGFRPAVDPLFRTAAKTFGPRVIGVVLSGGLDDGTEGLSCIKQSGGIAITQDPVEAAFPGMPESAIENVPVDHVLTIAKMPEVLSRLVRQPLPQGAGMPTRNPSERDPAEIGEYELRNDVYNVPPTALTCPECGGALWETHDGKLNKYRCHVGHSYTPQGLVANQNESLEAALWTAVRALEESAALRRRMADRAKRTRLTAMMNQYEQQARDAESRSNVIRRVLTTILNGDGEGDNATVHAGQSKKKALARSDGNGNGDENRSEKPGPTRRSGKTAKKKRSLRRRGSKST